MDFEFFTTINQFANTSWLLDMVGIFFAVYALPIFFVFFLILGIKKRTLLLQGVVGCSLAYGLNAIIGLVVARHRPFVDHVVHQLVEKSATSKSFPSDHAAIAFALASLIAIFYPKWAILLYVGVFLIAFSRVFVGVHYPTDIVAGAFVGIVSVFIVRRMVIPQLGSFH